MYKRLIFNCLLLFLLWDVGYTFFQHLQVSLDGDMGGGVIPTASTLTVLKDPFGFNVITSDAVYPNPNRFFAHWMFSSYFSTVPFMLQKIAHPVESIYLAAALAKTIIHIIFIALLSVFITGSGKIFNKQNIIAMALISPLFQTNGYISYMGIIDHSITYTFFYALPCCLLLLFYLPFFRSFFYGSGFPSGLFIKTALTILSIVLAFSGPLIPGIFLIISLMYFLIPFADKGYKKNKFRTFPVFLLILTGLLSVYSLYLGTHNSIFNGESLAIADRYLRLPEGIYYLVTQKIGFPLLIFLILLNFYIIRKHCNTDENNKILALFKWIGIFTLLYVLLLPLGGYKNYRPYILRYDTILPVTIALIFLFGISSSFILKHFKNSWYPALLIIFGLIFTIADEPEKGKNTCEKKALYELAASDQDPVLINSDCTIMAWEKITDPEDSKENANLFHFWRITTEKRLYYQK